MLIRTHRTSVLRLSLALLLGTVAVGTLAAEEAKQLRTGEAVILAALDEKTIVEFIEEPLSGVVEYYQATHNIRIQIDERALADVNMGPDAPVSESLDNITLRSALNLLLGKLDLTWIIADEVLLITTPERAEHHLIPRVYDVGRLVSEQDPDGELRHFDPLVSAITAAVEPASWVDVGGFGSISPLTCRGANVLTVRQTQAVHRQLARLLEALTTITEGRDELAARTAEDEMLAAFDEVVSVDFRGELLSSVLWEFEEDHNIQFVFCSRAFDRPLRPFTMHLQDVTLRSALNIILHDLGAAWTIRDEVVMITTPEEAEECLASRVYDVRNLAPVYDFNGRLWRDTDSLTSMLTCMVEPGGWDPHGDRCVVPFECRDTTVLIVRQSQRVQEKIAKLLDDLREIADGHEHNTQAAGPAEAESKAKAAEAAILAGLAERTSVDFVDRPLSAVLDQFQATHKIEIEIDTRALEDVNMGTDVPVSTSLRNITLRAALNLILGDLDLTWTISNEVLWITTPEEAELLTYPQIYDVTDLAKLVDKAGNPVESDFDSWIDLISGSVQPESWQNDPSIWGLEYGGSRVLVVYQTREVHEEITRLLADLRTTADKYGNDVFPVVEPSLHLDLFPSMGPMGGPGGGFRPHVPAARDDL